MSEWKCSKRESALELTQLTHTIGKLAEHRCAVSDLEQQQRWAQSRELFSQKGRESVFFALFFLSQ